MADTPARTLSERLDAARNAAAARKAREELERKERAEEIRRNVEANVWASRLARKSHGDMTPALRDWRRHESRRERARGRIKDRLSKGEYVLPSRDMKPLHMYLELATARAVKGQSFRGIEHFFVYHAATSDVLWSGFEYLYQHRDSSTLRVVVNILRSRVARASHGTPTTESLERTALRLYKRAGRPELCARYAQIVKNIAEWSIVGGVDVPPPPFRKEEKQCV